MNRKKTLIQKLWFNCEEATLLSTKQVYGEKISRLTKIRWWIHNLTCFPCWHFHKDNAKIQRLLNSQSSEHQLPTKIKQSIQAQLNKAFDGIF